MWGLQAPDDPGWNWAWVGYAALGLGLVAGLASAIIAIRTRTRRSGTSQQHVAADVRATISRLAEPAPLADVPADLAEWEQHASQVARHQLDLYLRHSAAALRQSMTSFRIGMAAASLGFLAILGSVAWLLAAGRDIAWLGVISGGVCEAVAALFFVEVRATRAGSGATLARVQAEADRVVRARGAMSVIQGITDQRTKEALLADIGRWLLDGGGPPPGTPAASMTEAESMTEAGGP